MQMVFHQCEVICCLAITYPYCAPHCKKAYAAGCGHVPIHSSRYVQQVLIRNTDLARRKRVWLRHTSNRCPVVAALSGVEAIARRMVGPKDRNHSLVRAAAKQREPRVGLNGQTTRTPCRLECMNGRANERLESMRIQATLAYAGAVSSSSSQRLLW